MVYYFDHKEKSKTTHILALLVYIFEGHPIINLNAKPQYKNAFSRFKYLPCTLEVPDKIEQNEINKIVNMKNLIKNETISKIQ